MMSIYLGVYICVWQSIAIPLWVDLDPDPIARAARAREDSAIDLRNVFILL